MISAEELAEKLKDVPFMSLHREFDLERMKTEAAQVTEYTPYVTVYGDAELKEKYFQAWAGRSLLAFEENSTSGMTEFVGQQIEQAKGKSLVKTDLGALCPYLMEVTEQLRGHYRHARLMRIAPQSSLTWHSHVDNQGQRPTTLTVHVPIQMPENFLYCVTPKENLRKDTRGRTEARSWKRVWAARFTPGRATYFNSYHYHNVYNRSDEQRISLMLYLNLRDEPTRLLFAEALEKYTGPKIV